MDCCSTGCQSVDPGEAPQIKEAAERLARLLAERQEFQAYVREARAVAQDKDVNQIMVEINERAYLYNPNASYAAEEANLLEERLEAQPAVIAFRQAERAARLLFHSVDQTISAAAGAGAAFAVLAKPSGHG